jgi:hypothetical protein
MDNKILGPNNQEYKLSGGSLQSLNAGFIDPYTKALQLTDPEQPLSSAFEGFTAGFKTSNPEVNIARAIKNQSISLSGDELATIGYDPFETLDPKYYAYADRFAGVKSEGESLWVQGYIDQLEKEQAAAVERPIANILGIVAGAILSPINLATAGGASAGLQAANIGSSVARGVVIGATTTAPLAAAQYAGSRPGYTAKDAATEIAIGAALGGAIDGTIARFGKSGLVSKPDNSRVIGREMVSKYEDFAETIPESRLTQSQYITPEEGVAIGGEGAGKAVFDLFTSGGVRNFQPSVSARLLTSPVPEVRQLTNDLVEHGFVLKGNIKGVAYDPSVESLINAREMGNFRTIDEIIDSGYVEHRRAGGKLSPDAFEAEVAMTIRRGGSTQPAADNAAGQYNKLMSVYAERLKTSGALPEDFKPGTNYLTRMYDRDAITADPEGWRNTLRPYIEDAVQSEYSKELKDLGQPININTFGEVVDVRTEKALDEITSKILGARYYDGEGLIWTNASAKTRTLDIPDAVLEKFLRNDIRTIGKAYVSRTEKDIAMHERFGTSNKDEILGRIEAAYERALSDNNYDVKLQGRMKDDIADLSAVFDRIYGVRGLPKDFNSLGSKIITTLPTFNMVRMLGGVVLSQMPEFFKSQLLRATQWISTSMDDFVKQVNLTSLKKSDLKALGAILEHSHQMNALSQGDIGMQNFLAKQGVVKKALGVGTELFLKASGMEFMDNTTRSSLAVTGSRWMYALSKKLTSGATLTKKEVTWLAQHGIDDRYAADIIRQAKKHGEKVGGVHYLNISEWEGKTGDIMRAAVRKYVNSYLINPGAGDKFLFADVNPLAKLMMQFKSWFQGAWSRQLLPSLQNFDSQRLALMTTMVALAFLQNRVLQILMPETYKQPRDLNQELIEAVNRSGALPFLFDGAMIAATTTGFGGTVRQQQSGLIDTVFGPSAGLLARNIPAVGRITTGHGRPGDFRAVKELIPYNNLIWIREYNNKIANKLDQDLRAKQKLGENS